MPGISHHSPLAENVLNEWERITGTPILEGYGQSEARISFNPLDGVRKPTSVGIPLPATEIQVVDLETAQTFSSPGKKERSGLPAPR